MDNAIVFLLFFSFFVCIYLLYSKRKCSNRLIDSLNIISKSSGTILIVDKNTQIKNVINLETLSYFEVTADEIRNKNLSDFSNNNGSSFNQLCAKICEELTILIQTNQPISFCYKTNEIFLEVIIKPLDNGYIVITITDITLSTKASHDFVKKKQNEIEVALYAGGLSSWSYDVQKQTFDSEVYNEVISKSIHYNDLLAKVFIEDQEFMNNAFNSLISKEKTQMEFTVRCSTKTGEIEWLNVHGISNTFDINGNVKTIIGSQKNRTKDIESMNELIKLRIQAEDSNKMKTAFIANISHEIRTPLNAIIGFSDLISTAEDKEEINEYIKIIAKNNTLLLNIITDIIDLSEIESGKITYNLNEINVSSLLHDIKTSCLSMIKKEVDVVIDNHLEDTTITSDSKRLTQVLLNFLTNAIKFTSHGTINIGYTIENDGDIRIYVKDTGIGIAEENQPRVFDRFVKLNNFVQGTGLGLPICKSIIESMGGTIGMESKLGEGSIFWIKIPPTFTT